MKNVTLKLRKTPLECFVIQFTTKGSQAWISCTTFSLFSCFHVFRNFANTLSKQKTLLFSRYKL